MYSFLRKYRPVDLVDPGEYGPACPGHGCSLGHCPLCAGSKQPGAISSLQDGMIPIGQGYIPPPRQLPDHILQRFA